METFVSGLISPGYSDSRENHKIMSKNLNIVSVAFPIVFSATLLISIIFPDLPAAITKAFPVSVGQETTAP